MNGEGEEDHNLMSIDTGMNGNLFGGRYFSMNADHMEGKLKRIYSDFDRYAKKDEGDDRNFILQIKQKKDDILLEKK